MNETKPGPIVVPPPYQSSVDLMAQKTQLPVEKVAENNNLATATLIIGIIGFMLSLFFIGGIFGVVAVVLGIRALRQGQARRRAVIGVVLGVLAVIIGVISLISFANLTNSSRQQNSSQVVSLSMDDFTTYKESSPVSYIYPKEWLAETDQYESSATVINRSYSHYTSIQKGILAERMVYSYSFGSVQSITQDQLAAYANKAKASPDQLKPDIAAFALCSGVNVTSTSDFNQNGLRGAQLNFNCNFTPDNGTSKVAGYFIIAKDTWNVQHEFTIFTTGGSLQWQANKPIFDYMVKNITWRDTGGDGGSQCSGTQTGNLCVTGGKS